MRFIAALMLCVCACDGCNDDTLASVTQTVGQVDRDRADRAHVWSDAAVGDELELGDGIRTGTSATARLSLTRGGSLEVRPQTILRFGAGAAGDGSYSLSLGMGEIVVETEEGGTTHSFLGALVLEAGSRVRLTADGDLEVILGALDLQLSNGESLALGEGESYGAEGAGEKVLAEPIDLATESGAPADWTVRTAVRAQTRVTESGTWGDVAQEAPLVAGAAIRARSRGSFAIAASSVVEGEARARLRILEAERVRAGTGAFTFRTDREPLIVESPSGTLRIAAGSVLKFDADTGRGELIAGSAEWEHNGELHELGESGEFGIASLDRSVTRIPEGEAPESWVFEIGSGRGGTIHSPSVPLKMGLRIDRSCPGGAVTLGSGRSARRYAIRDGLAPFTVGRGRTPYVVHCPGEEPTRGSLQVLRDGGTSPLPRTAPTTRVELDGRRYTVHYQNRLPAFDVRWKEANGSAVLMVDREASGRGNGEWDLESGTLREGLHTLSARAGAREAPNTQVLVRFDNVAPKIALRSPANESFAPGEEVTVEGILLPGWQPYLGGRPVSVSDTGRFTTTHHVRGDRSGFVIELRHPQRGVHYYVREAR